MALGPGRPRLITAEWAELLDSHCGARGVAAEVCRRVGCSEATLSRLRRGKGTVSEWVEPISGVCSLPLPPIAVDEEIEEAIGMLVGLPRALRTAAMENLRALMRAATEGNDENTEQ